MKRGINFVNTYTCNSFPGETVQISATTVSSSVTFVLPASAQNYDCVVTNAGPATAFIAFGLKGQSGGVVAQVPGFGSGNGTPNATPILSGAIYTFQKQSDNALCDTVAAITSVGTATVFFTTIQGS